MIGLLIWIILIGFGIVILSENIRTDRSCKHQYPIDGFHPVTGKPRLGRKCSKCGQWRQD